QRHGERGRHAIASGGVHAGVVDRHVGGLENPRQQLVVGRGWRGFAERADRGLDGELTRDFAVAVAAQTVRPDGGGTASGLFLFISRVPETQIVFVVRAD